MGFEIQARRPPYVEFITDVVVDPVATAANGYQTMKSADFVQIRVGPRDTFIQEVNEWFKQAEQNVKNGTFERQWLPIYRQAYKEYQSTGETPLNGMPIAQWAQINKAQAMNLQSQGCKTVEDLAEWPDGELPNLGMGARALKEQAQAWLKSAEKGKSAAVIEKLTVENDDLKRRLARLEAALGTQPSFSEDTDLIPIAREPIAPKKKSYYQKQKEKHLAEIEANKG